MNTNAQIISDLRHKIGPYKTVDFLSHWKGVPVMIKGYIQEVRSETIIFRTEPPDSICFAQDECALILHDVFIMGIQGRILAFDPKDGIVEIGEFIYIDRGFGDRSMVRVEPETHLPAVLYLDETSLSCQVVDLSLSGFGLLAESTEELKAAKEQTVKLQMRLSDQELEIPGTLVDILSKGDTVRLAMSFTHEVPHHGILAHYITRRRAEIRQEIEAAYQNAVGYTI